MRTTVVGQNGQSRDSKGAGENLNGEDEADASPDEEAAGLRWGGCGRGDD